MPTVLQAVGLRSPPTGQADVSAHGRPSLQTWRGAPLHWPLAQSAFAPHAVPVAPACSPGRHTFGPMNTRPGGSPIVTFHAGPHEPLHAVVASHALHSPAKPVPCLPQIPDSHCSLPTHCSPSTRVPTGS